MWLTLSISDISLWLAITAIILLVTSELLYSLPDLHGRLTVNKNRFRYAALGCGAGFLATVFIRGLEII
jgi:hypothetical protein